MVKRRIRIAEAGVRFPPGPLAHRSYRDIVEARVRFPVSPPKLLSSELMKNQEPKIENSGELRKYTYRDSSAGGKVVFECVAKDILDADKMYQEKTGKNPEKQSYIGCSIEKIESDTEKQ